MKKYFRTTLRFVLLCCLTLGMMASCSTASRSTKQASTDPTFLHRQQLTPEQQREYDKTYLEAICQKLKGNNDAAHDLLEHALTINPMGAEALFELGNILLATPTSAINAHDSIASDEQLLILRGDSMLQMAVALEPSNPYYRERLAHQLISTERYEDALPLFEVMAEQKPTEQNLNVLARLYEMEGDFDKAIATFSHLEALAGYDKDIAVELYRIYMATNQPEKAFASFERLVDNEPNIQNQLMLGDAYLSGGNQEKAHSIYTDVLAKHPYNFGARAAMLRYHSVQNDTASINSGLTSIMLDPAIENSDKLSLLRAYAIEQTEATPDKVTISTNALYGHFCEALTLPQDNSMLMDLCIAYSDLAVLPAECRIQNYRTALHHFPDDYEARLLLLQDAVLKQDIEGIASLCHEGTVHSPEQLIFYYYEGMSLFQQGRTSDAIEVYERASTAITEDSDAEMASDIYATLGDIYHENGQKQQAYAAYDSALTYKADNIACLNNYAYFLSLDGKQLDKAAAMSKQTVDAEPTNPTYLDTYAWILYRQGQYTQARIYIDETLSHLPAEELEAPSAASLYDHAGDIYFRLGDTDKAMNHWQHALRLSDDSKLTKNLNRKIKNKKP